MIDDTKRISDERLAEVARYYDCDRAIRQCPHGEYVWSQRHCEYCDEVKAITDELKELRARGECCFHAFAADAGEWSQRTFGRDSERGPEGPLHHLEREVAEALAARDDVTEYADCLLLILDASRRAGFDSHALLNAAIAKLEVNKARTWGKPNAKGFVEHLPVTEVPNQ